NRQICDGLRSCSTPDGCGRLPDLAGWSRWPLARQEVERVGRQFSAERGLAFRPIREGQPVRGKLVGLAQLASGGFAMIDDELGFSLVPWQPVLEKEIGRQVIGVMRGGDISWQLGRAMGIGL